MDQTSKGKLKTNFKPLLINPSTSSRMEFQTRYNKSSQIKQSTTAKLYANQDVNRKPLRVLADDLHAHLSQYRMGLNQDEMNEKNDEFRKLGRELRQISEQFEKLYTNRCLDKDDVCHTLKKLRIAFTTCLVFWGLLIARSNSSAVASAVLS